MLLFLQKSKLKHSLGFTLIELLVVISIIGILSTVVLSGTTVARQKSRDTERIAELKQISTALELYYLNNGSYPNGGQFGMFADSRNPPRATVPPYSNLMSHLVPNYLPYAPLPPNNNGGDGAMCGGCDEYRYHVRPFGTGYALCTYVADPAKQTDSNVFGPFYCIFSNCVQAGQGIMECQLP